MKSAFLPDHQRCDLIYSVIKPGYAKIREPANLTVRSRDNHCRESAGRVSARPYRTVLESALHIFPLWSR